MLTLPPNHLLLDGASMGLTSGMRVSENMSMFAIVDNFLFLDLEIKLMVISSNKVRSLGSLLVV